MENKTIKLIDIIPFLSNNYDMKIGVDGNYVGQFGTWDDIPYKYLKLNVKCIYPITNKVGTYTGIDLTTKEIKDMESGTI